MRVNLKAVNEQEGKSKGMESSENVGGNEEIFSGREPVATGRTVKKMIISGREEEEDKKDEEEGSVVDGGGAREALSDAVQSKQSPGKRRCRFSPMEDMRRCHVQV